jgi:hypothetical protein
MRQIPKKPDRMESPSRTFTWVKYSLEPERKTEHEYSIEEEVSNLHPPLLAKTERPDKVVPGAAVSAMRLLRLGGLIVIVIGTWCHVMLLIPLVLVVILLGWLHGILFPVTALSTQ